MFAAPQLQNSAHTKVVVDGETDPESRSQGSSMLGDDSMGKEESREGGEERKEKKAELKKRKGGVEKKRGKELKKKHTFQGS